MKNFSSIRELSKKDVGILIVQFIKYFFTTLIGVIQARGLFIIFGFVVGGFLVWLSIPVHKSAKIIATFGELGAEEISLVIKELGVGFFVAAIAVFGYEWNSHAKEALTLIKKLIRIRESDGLERIQLSLKGLFGECPEAEKLHKDVFQLISFSNEIAKIESPEKHEYLKVIAWLLDEPVKENAERLKEWLLNERDGQDWEYFMPYGPTKAAASILSAQMKILLRSGGTYDSISRISFWNGDDLNYYFDRTADAVNAGKTVRRIFNLCNDLEIENILKAARRTKVKLNSDHKKRIRAINTIIDKHQELAKESGAAYQIKFFLPDHVSEVRDKTRIERIRIENARFGLFKIDDAKYYVRFVSEDEKLLRIRMSYCRKNDESVNLFDVMWEKARSENPFKTLEGSI